MKSLIRVLTLVGTFNYLLIVLIDAAPTTNELTSTLHGAPKASITQQHDIAPPAPVTVHKSMEAPDAILASPKVSRAVKVSGPAELDTQETGYLPSSYPSATESDYGYDAGKNTYGKQASDWSLYDQGKWLTAMACLLVYQAEVKII